MQRHAPSQEGSVLPFHLPGEGLAFFNETAVRDGWRLD